MKPYYEHDNIVIYHADARDLLGSLPKCDSMITDPPYGIITKCGSSTLYGKRTMQFGMDQVNNIMDTVRDVTAAIAQIVQSVHIFCDPDHYGSIAAGIRKHGFTVKPWARIKKNPPPPYPGSWWPSGFEIAMYGFRPGAYFGDTSTKRKNTYVSDSYRFNSPRSREKVNHPTQKWLPMIEYLVNTLVATGGSCIDPFMGSGTTLVAAKLCRRRAIGIEINEEYCEIAVERLRQGVLV